MGLPGVSVNIREFKTPARLSIIPDSYVDWFIYCFYWGGKTSSFDLSNWRSSGVSLFISFIRRIKQQREDRTSWSTGLCPWPSLRPTLWPQCVLNVMSRCVCTSLLFWLLVGFRCFPPAVSHFNDCIRGEGPSVWSITHVVYFNNCENVTYVDQSMGFWSKWTSSSELRW